MKILDNKKDYYDFYEGVYGIDEKVVFDRRGSVNYSDFLKKLNFKTPTESPGKTYESEINRIRVRIGFNIYEFEKERIPEEDIPGARAYSGYISGKNWVMPDTIYEEIGWRKWNTYDNPRRVSRDYLEKVQEKRDKNPQYIREQYIGQSPSIKIPPVEIEMFVDNEHSESMTRNVLGTDRVVYNPILRDYPAVASFISPDIVWQDIYEFITTMSEKVIVDNRTDIEHIESAGFDKKTSFRKDKEKKR